VPNALVVADDLTGAMDTGQGFAQRGRAVRVVLAGDDGEERPTADADVLAVDTDGRDRPASDAARRVRAAIAAHPAPLVYKKVDSTLRGNVVAEVDAALDATGADLAVVAPAFPATGRTTVDGVHRVDGAPLAEAGYGVEESDLRRFFAASQYPVEHIDDAVVDGGETAVRDALAAASDRDSPAIAVCDAASEDDLRAIADGAGALDADVLYVGSGGLATHVAVPGDPPADSETAATTRDDRTGVLGVVGSVNERTLTQLATVPDEAVVALDPAAAVRNPDATGRDAVAALATCLDDGARAVVTAATDPEDVAAAERAAAEAGSDAGAAVRRALAAAAAGTVDERPVAGLVLTGGDVARAVLDALDATAIDLDADPVAAGIPAGRIRTGRAAGVRVVTKAGGFGERGAILNCLDALAS
jgi:uncharacterized protein YgbK (DUF1537 family)